MRHRTVLRLLFPAGRRRHTAGCYWRLLRRIRRHRQYDRRVRGHPLRTVRPVPVAGNPGRTSALIPSRKCPGARPIPSRRSFLGCALAYRDPCPSGLPSGLGRAPFGTECSQRTSAPRPQPVHPQDRFRDRVLQQPHCRSLSAGSPSVPDTALATVPFPAQQEKGAARLVPPLSVAGPGSQSGQTRPEQGSPIADQLRTRRKCAPPGNQR